MKIGSVSGSANGGIESNPSNGEVGERALQPQHVVEYEWACVAGSEGFF